MENALFHHLELIAIVAVTVVLGVTLWLLWQVLRQQGRLLLRLEAFETRVAEAKHVPLTSGADGETEAGLAVGTQAPDFRLQDQEGTPVTLPVLLHLGKPVVLLFADPDCEPRSTLFPEMGRWQRDYQSLLTLAVVSHQGKAHPPGVSRVLLQEDREVQMAYQVSGTPSAVLIRADGTIGSPIAQSVSATQRLIVEALGLSMRDLPPLPVSPFLSSKETPTMKPSPPALLDLDQPATMGVLPAKEPCSTLPEALQTHAATEILPWEAEEKIELTIGMATYDDFDGVYFTLQALRLYQDLSHVELLVIDNYGCELTQQLVEKVPSARYIRATNVVGTAAPRDLVFREARGNAVLCCDCHVLFAPGVITKLKQYYREHPDCQDLLQGPLLYDDGKRIATHMDPYWRMQMWGTWETDPRGLDPDGEPFEIPMHGLGAFSCRTRAWLGFHPDFRGFGGEEGYIHEKFRQAGARCLCLPWFRWLHRFGRPGGVTYPFTLEHRIRNYVIGHSELGLSLVPVLQHFSQFLPQERVIAVTELVRSGKWEPR